ncbi:hypothetical protein [Taibaiella chishuiensis]|uniref:Lipoprotein n=1 Tax=Taibaiella chishuiensis TaxID=1434707 RepID=A0A2P8DAY7_9BACT|nr:hypothetical protein [Taibaiella chishuiensis]PSK94347.1 hypothetical protein B0I18_101502 [Taibaiella chishuiensis]
MLKKIRLFILLLCIPLLCSSCFEIIEEITMKADGSGDMVLTVNLSQSKTKVASILLMDSINGYKVPDRKTIQREIDEAVARLKKMPGISNVKSTTDFNNYIASISFSFKEVANVNNITKNILEAQKVKATNVSTYTYNKSTATFARDYKYYASAKAEYNKLKKEDKEIFQTATYTSICRFPAAISRHSNTLAKVSKSQKAIMQKCSVLDLINGRVSVSNQIQLAK